MLLLHNRLLSKPIYNEEFLGEAKMSTAVYKDVHEEQQVSTTKLSLEIEFGKKFNEVLCMVLVMAVSNDERQRLIDSFFDEKEFEVDFTDFISEFKPASGWSKTYQDYINKKHIFRSGYDFLRFITGFEINPKNDKQKEYLSEKFSSALDPKLAKSPAIFSYFAHICKINNSSGNYPSISHKIKEEYADVFSTYNCFLLIGLCLLTKDYIELVEKYASTITVEAHKLKFNKFIADLKVPGAFTPPNNEEKKKHVKEELDKILKLSIKNDDLDKNSLMMVQLKDNSSRNTVYMNQMIAYGLAQSAESQTLQSGDGKEYYTRNLSKSHITTPYIFWQNYISIDVEGELYRPLKNILSIKDYGYFNKEIQNLFGVDQKQAASYIAYQLSNNNTKLSKGVYDQDFSEVIFSKEAKWDIGPHIVKSLRPEKYSAKYIVDQFTSGKIELPDGNGNIVKAEIDKDSFAKSVVLSSILGKKSSSYIENITTNFKDGKLYFQNDIFFNLDHNNPDINIAIWNDAKIKLYPNDEEQEIINSIDQKHLKSAIKDILSNCGQPMKQYFEKLKAMEGFDKSAIEKAEQNINKKLEKFESQALNSSLFTKDEIDEIIKARRVNLHFPSNIVKNTDEISYEASVSSTGMLYSKKTDKYSKDVIDPKNYQLLEEKLPKILEDKKPEVLTALPKIIPKLEDLITEKSKKKVKDSFDKTQKIIDEAMNNDDENTTRDFKKEIEESFKELEKLRNDIPNFYFVNQPYSSDKRGKIEKQELYNFGDEQVNEFLGLIVDGKPLDSSNIWFYINKAELDISSKKIEKDELKRNESNLKEKQKRLESEISDINKFTIPKQTIDIDSSTIGSVDLSASRFLIHDENTHKYKINQEKIDELPEGEKSKILHKLDEVIEQNDKYIEIKGHIKNLKDKYNACIKDVEKVRNNASKDFIAKYQGNLESLIKSKEFLEENTKSEHIEIDEEDISCDILGIDFNAEYKKGNYKLVNFSNFDRVIKEFSDELKATPHYKSTKIIESYNEEKAQGNWRVSAKVVNQAANMVGYIVTGIIEGFEGPSSKKYTIDEIIQKIQCHGEISGNKYVSDYFKKASEQIISSKKVDSWQKKTIEKTIIISAITAALMLTIAMIGVAIQARNPDIFKNIKLPGAKGFFNGFSNIAAKFIANPLLSIPISAASYTLLGVSIYKAVNNMSAKNKHNYEACGKELGKQVIDLLKKDNRLDTSISL